MPLAKLLRTAKRGCFVSGKAKSAGILDMYSEYFQRSPARKNPFCGCRIPKLHALNAALFFFRFLEKRNKSLKGFANYIIMINCMKVCPADG